MYHRFFLKNLVYAVAFSLLLLCIRVISLGSGLFLFLVWNFFLAAIPYAITCVLRFSVIRDSRLLFWLGFCIWLAFLPNAPYILTDLQHLTISTLQFIWFDVLLILSFAINGLLIGFASLRMMQELLLHRFSKKITNAIIHSALLLCGFGIYLGRIVRWNSWDVIQHPIDLLGDIATRILFPIAHIETWAFTMGFGGFLIICYQFTFVGITNDEYHRNKKLHN